MRRIIKNLTLTGLSGLLCLFLAIPANAQHRGSFGGGGGGGRSSGGGFSGGGGGGRSFGGGGFSGGSRQSFGGGAGGSRQSFGGGMQGGSRQSFGGGVQSAPRQSYGGSRQSYGNVNPGVGRQSFGGRTQGLQGNTQAFGNRTYSNRGAYSSGRVGINGNRGSFNGRTGVTTRISPRYYGRNFYSGGRANYGRGYSYSPWSSRSGYYYNRGYYRSSYFPRLGISLGYLPYGYYPFYWGGLQFYYSDGYFYQYDNNQYTVVEPPVGAAVNTLPSGAQSIVINGQQYYELNGVYYQPITQDNGKVVYQVAGKDGQLETDEPNLNDYNGDYDAPMDYGQPNVSQDQGPQIGDIVSDLPSDTRKIKINGEKFIVSPDDYYYKETRDSNGKKVYEIVGTPNDNPGDN
jgi:hypothetical protein